MGFVFTTTLRDQDCLALQAACLLQKRALKMKGHYCMIWSWEPDVGFVSVEGSPPDVRGLPQLAVQVPGGHL